MGLKDVQEFIGLEKNRVIPLIFTFKAKGDPAKISEILNRVTLKTVLGIDPTDTFIIQEKDIDKAHNDFAIIFAKAKTQNRLLVMILVDDSGVSNGKYFERLEDYYKKESKKEKEGERLQINSVMVPSFNVGTVANVYDVIGKDKLNTWDKIENEIMSKMKWGKGEQHAAKRRLEVIMVTSQSGGDVSKISNDMGGVISGKSVLFKQASKNYEGLEKSFDIPISKEFHIMINKYETGNTIQIVLLFKRDQFKDSELFNDKYIPVPLNDVGKLITRKDIINALDEAEALIYWQFGKDVKDLEKAKSDDMKETLKKMYMPMKQ